MAIYIHCPQCHQRLQEMREDCAHCGTVLPPGVFYALAAALGASSPVPPMPPGWVPRHVTSATSVASPPPPDLSPPPVQHSPLRPWLAAALSLFCGLGQLYNGQVIKGIVLLVLGVAALLSLQLSLGKIMVPLLWMYAIVDAYMVARRSNP